MRQEFRDVPLDAMLEACDHLRIRISLMEDENLDTQGSVAEAKRELAALEQRIAEHRRGRAPTGSAMDQQN